MPLRDFDQLNERLSWHALLREARMIENSWAGSDAAVHWQRLVEFIGIMGAKFPHTKIVLDPLIAKLDPSKPLDHFLGLIVPIERVEARGILDHDWLKPSDRAEALGPMLPLTVVVDNMRSAFNVGSILRTAECLNAAGVILCGYTATPESLKTKKTAMGVESIVSWSKARSAREAVCELKEAGHFIYAAEVDPRATSVFETNFAAPAVLVLGNERHGLDPDILGLVDQIVSIPMSGRKNSLNVGVAFGAIGFEIHRQWQHANQPKAFVGAMHNHDAMPN